MEHNENINNGNVLWLSAGCISSFGLSTLNSLACKTSRPSVLLVSSQNRRQNNGSVDETLSLRQNNGSSISLLTVIYGLVACIGNVLFIAFNFVTIGPIGTISFFTNWKLQIGDAHSLLCYSSPKLEAVELKLKSGLCKDLALTIDLLSP